jgi:hypothetical protein
MPRSNSSPTCRVQGLSPVHSAFEDPEYACVAFGGEPRRQTRLLSDEPESPADGADDRGCGFEVYPETLDPGRQTQLRVKVKVKSV